MRYLLGLLWVCAAVAQEPVPVASFETAEDQPFVAGGATLKRVEAQASAGRWALEVTLPGAATDSWPGFYLVAGDDPDWSRRELLEFDIFLAGDQETSLSFRLDDRRGKTAFGGARLRPGWNRGWRVHTKGLVNEVDLTQIKQLLLYARMPRETVVLYVDNVRWNTFAGRFNKVAWLDTATPIAANDAERERGAIVFRRPTFSLVFPTSYPDNRLRRLELVVARGEQEPTSLSLHALRGLQQVAVSVSELAGPGVATIRPAAWDKTVLRHLDKRVHYASQDYVVDVPSYLAAHDAPVAVPGGTTRTFHLTLDCPRDAVPGVYHGSVGVKIDGRNQTIPLRVRVLPFELPELDGLLYGEYYRRFGQLTATAEQMRADLADMRRHQMTSVGLCFGVEASSYEVAGGDVTFTWRGDTPFEWFMDAYRDLGFPAPIVLLSDSGQAAAAKAGDYATAAYDALYVKFYQVLERECRAKGWPTIYVQPVDEPGWQSQADRDRNVHLLKLLHAAGLPTEQDGPGDDYFHRVAGPYATIWNYNGAIGPRAVVDEALANGHLITLYNNDVESYRPETDRWAYGFFNWRHGLHGGFNWEYRGGTGDLYDNLDGEHGDWVHRYPPTATEPGGPSTGWEASREGVDDRRYLALLEGLVAARREREPQSREAAAGEALLQALRQRLPDQRTVRNAASFEAVLSAAQAKAAGYRLPAGAVKVVTGQLKLPNTLTFDETDTLRWAVAEQCVRLWETAATPGLGRLTWRPRPPAARLADWRRSATRLVATPPRPSLRVPTLKAAPTLDGEIEADPHWAGSAAVALTRNDGGGRPDGLTDVRFGLHQNQLYVAFVCHEDRLGSIAAAIREPDGPVWTDDCVEVFLDPGASEQRFYQVIVNSLGTIARRGADGQVWQAPVKAATRVDQARQRWQVELAIPVGELALGPRFGLNFGRERRPLEVFELTSWSPTGGSFGQPARFGLAVVEGPTPTVAAPAPRLIARLEPSWLTLSEPTTRLVIDTAMAPAQETGARLTVRVQGPGTALTERLPGSAAGHLEALLGVSDLAAGDYRVTVELSVPNAAPVTVSLPLKRLPGPFDWE